MNQPTVVKKDKLQIIDWLIEHFPGAFFKKANQVRPLKLGIFDDIIDFYERMDTPPFSKKSLREGLSYYSASPAYLSCQKVNTARIDIYGNEVDVVTAEQAKYAHQRFQERYTKKKLKLEENPIKIIRTVARIRHSCNPGYGFCGYLIKHQHIINRYISAQRSLSGYWLII